MGFILATLGSLLGALASLAAYTGAQHVVDAVTRAKLEKQNLTPSTVTNLVDDIVKAAKIKGNSVYNRVLEKLNALQLPPQASSKIQNLILDKRRRLAGLRDEARETLNKAEAEETKAQSTAGAYAYLSKHEQSLINKKGSTANTLKSTAENVANQAKEYYQQLGNIERKI